MYKPVHRRTSSNINDYGDYAKNHGHLDNLFNKMHKQGSKTYKRMMEVWQNDIITDIKKKQTKKELMDNKWSDFLYKDDNKDFLKNKISAKMKKHVHKDIKSNVQTKKK